MSTHNPILTHWGRMMQIIVSKPTMIGSGKGLSTDRHREFIWTNAGVVLSGRLRAYYSESLIETHTSSFKKMHLKMSFGKWLPSCLDINVLKIEMLSQ